MSLPMEIEMAMILLPMIFPLGQPEAILGGVFQIPRQY